jgi:hypothetical protein
MRSTGSNRARLLVLLRDRAPRDEAQIARDLGLEGRYPGPAGRASYMAALVETLADLLSVNEVTWDEGCGWRVTWESEREAARRREARGGEDDRAAHPVTRAPGRVRGYGLPPRRVAR